jgi:hypothetical protein
MLFYVYIATPTEWGNKKNGHYNGFKIGYTANPTQRNYILRSTDGYTIRATYSMEGDKYDGQDLEKMTQRIYRRGYPVKQVGNDYFKTSKVTTAKAVRHFTEIVNKAREMMGV